MLTVAIPYVPPVAAVLGLDAVHLPVVLSLANQRIVALLLVAVCLGLAEASPGSSADSDECGDLGADKRLQVIERVLDNVTNGAR